MQAIRHGTMLPSLQRKEIGTSELEPFRSSILGPWSPLGTLHGCPREQNLVHPSGSGRLARPSPWGTFSSYSLPAFLAHSVPGVKLRRTQDEHMFSGSAKPTFKPGTVRHNTYFVR